jgi:flagellar biosynthetic protein FliQ
MPRRRYCPATDMTPEFAVELVKTMMFQAVALAAPVLLAGMVVGLAVSLFQAVTSIHEQTLTFVPKALAVVVVLVLLLPWILRTLIEFAVAVIEKIPEMVR